ncbi:MAG: magnesium protoporphyrin IX methyltransferase [Caulobacterales bacterium]|jgi:magnesium-protoporphyrin O-methyltransferase
MPTATFDTYRGRLETYFDRTAKDAWEQLTSDAPVSKIRETVRAGRDRMRAHLLSWLPEDLAGARILDAGCGTGALAVEAARRGAHVVAVDVSASLIEIAKARAPAFAGPGAIDFRVGDMLDPAHGRFDYAVAMDSLIHYPATEVVTALSRIADRTTRSIAFTFAPRTPALSLMHAVGLVFPRSDRAPAIVPIGDKALRDRLSAELRQWRIGPTERISSGFYTSQAQLLEGPS